MQKVVLILFFLGLIHSAQSVGLTIRSPAGLKEWWDNHQYETHTSLAAFGYNPWGRKIFGRLQLANPIDACSYIKQSGDEFQVHPIMVAKRGNCTFVMKAHYAQLAGARMLIIVDNTYEEVELRLMVDAGGLGESVTIPVTLLSKPAGEKLIVSLQSPDPNINNIVATYDFSLPKSNHVNYHIWLSSATGQSFKFIREWKEKYYDMFAKNTTLNVHYAHFSETPGLSANDPNCICGGRYCAPDPDGDNPNNGANVLIEDLRQMCILHEISPEAWWGYMQNYDDFCLTDGDMDRCSQQIMLTIGVTADEVNACVQRSFDVYDLKKCTRNKFLEAEEQAMIGDNVYIFPDVVINNFTFRGNLIPASGVAEAICESFQDMPRYCTEDIGLTVDTVPNKIMHSNHAMIAIASVVFLIFFAFFVFFCYRQYLRRELRKQMVRDVNIAVSQYIAFKDEGHERETSRLSEA